MFDGPDGATCRYFNAGAHLAWRHRLGDWVDAAGRPQGAKPLAIATVGGKDRGPVAEWDVTELVRAWTTGAHPNTGVMLAPVRGRQAGAIAFFSREAQPRSARPRLIVQLGGMPDAKTFAPVADATLNCSTAYALGRRDELRIGPDERSILQFDVAGLHDRVVARATLVLTAREELRQASIVGLFRLDPPGLVTHPVLLDGLARSYPLDAGIDGHPEVMMATGFETPQWREAWSYVAAHSHAERIDQDPDRLFEPHAGNALRVTIAKDEHFGLDMAFNFRDKLGYEPEEAYFRYYMRLANDWVPFVDGGKLPGFAGTYGRAGWGGRKADPKTGWSLRGQFNRAPSAGNPLHTRTAIGTYAYHADMEDTFGDHWYWTQHGSGLLERNRWFCIEQYVRVNTPGSKDGVLRAWIDGRLAFEKTDLHVRDVASLKVEKVWMNVYHGGTAKAARDMSLYLDNVVIARQPIGCMPR